MKVLVVSSKLDPEYSGSGHRARSTYKRLSNNYGVSYDLLCNSLEFSGRKTYTLDGAEIYRISSPIKYKGSKKSVGMMYLLFSVLYEFFFTFLYIRRKIDDYDLLHSFGNSWSVGFLTLYFSLYKKPVVRELCNDLNNPFYPVQLRPFIRKAFKNPNTLMIPISGRLENVCRHQNVQRFWLRANPVDENKFFINYDEKLTLRRMNTKFTSEDIVMVHVANFRRNKNQDFSIRLLTLLPEKYKLFISGPLKPEEEGYFEELICLIDKLGLLDRVEMRAGYINNIEQYMQLADVFLFPSVMEGLGTPALEAQFCGVPVVANRIAGVTDLSIADGEGGFTCHLDLIEFSQKVRDSIQINTETLFENQQRLMKRASSSYIDATYITHFKKLIHT